MNKYKHLKKTKNTKRKLTVSEKVTYFHEREAKEMYYLNSGRKIPQRLYIFKARLYIYTALNNTFLTLTDLKGNVLISSSSGLLSLVNKKKGGYLASIKSTKKILKFLKIVGVNNLDVFVKGVGYARPYVLKYLVRANVKILRIKDLASKAHNGCRLKKEKRL